MTSTLARFKASLSGSEPDLPPLLEALWREANGDWEAAHRLAQTEDTESAAWVHAYLHRREGDLGNARGWYRRAGREESTRTLEASGKRS